MTWPIALVCCPDVGPLDSLAVMLRAAGFAPHLPDYETVSVLRSCGDDAAGRPEDLVRGMGYSPALPLPTLPLDRIGEVRAVFLLKAQRSRGRVEARFPSLKGRVIWYRINGGEPTHRIDPRRGDMGDEIRPGCPVVTPNRWYADETEDCEHCRGSGIDPESPRLDDTRPCRVCEGDPRRPTPWAGTPRYVMWPPLAGSYGQGLLLSPRERPEGGYGPPMCLVHNLAGWGYGDMAGPMRALGVKMYGIRSPDGLLDHDLVTPRLRAALAYVHLKSNDAPGYALLEAMANGVPVVCARRLIWRSRMQDLLVPGETCLTFDRETHDALTSEDVARLSNEIRDHLIALRDPDLNARLGRVGRERLEEVMWSPDRPADSDGFRRFLAENLPA